MEQDDSTVVISLTNRDRAFIHDLERFYREVQARLGELTLILVDETGCPVMPAVEAADIPDNAIWLPPFSP